MFKRPPTNQAMSASIIRLGDFDKLSAQPRNICHVRWPYRPPSMNLAAPCEMARSMTNILEPSGIRGQQRVRTGYQSYPAPKLLWLGQRFAIERQIVGHATDVSSGRYPSWWREDFVNIHMEPISGVHIHRHHSKISLDPTANLRRC